MMSKQVFYVFVMLMSSIQLIAQTSFNKSQSVALPLPGGNAPYNIASGYIDADAFPDLVVSTTIGDTVYWLRNDGSGNFLLQATPIGILDNAGGVAIADINSDGYNDVVSTSSNDGTLVWFQNDGLGNFGTAQLIGSSIGSPGQVYVRKIDNNSTLDVAVAAYSGNEVIWYANNGSGIFSAKNIINNTIPSPGAFAMRDIDVDGDIDCVIANAVNFGVPNDCRIEVFYNDGDGNFTPDTNVVALNSKDYIFSVMAEDVDNDSSLDILVTDITGDASWYKRTEISPGTATYTETVISTSIANPACLDLRDLDNDTYRDFVLTSASSGSGNDIVWFKSDGVGGFGPEQLIDATQNQAYTITFADFENDGDLDIATIAYGDDAVNMFENQKIVLGISEQDDSNLILFPNPTQQHLLVRGLTVAKEISIIDSLGKIILTAILQPDMPLDISQLESGLYIMEFKDSKVELKFIKK